MKNVFIGIISIVLANLAIGFLARSYDALSSVLVWFSFGTLLSVIWARDELFLKQTYSAMLASRTTCIAFIGLSIFAPVFYFIGVRDAGLGVSSVVANAKFGVLILTSFLIFNEKPKRNDILACLLLIPGFFLLTEVRDLNYNFGLFIALLAMLCYAGQNVINKILAFKVPYRAMVSIRSLAVSLGVACYMLVIGKTPEVPMELQFWIPIVLGAPFGIIISKYADFKALEEVSFFTFSIWQPLRPVLILCLSALVLQEEFTLNKSLGCTLLIASSAIASIGSRPSKIRN
jgi:drug/metabolite transporter (DMT)-like permease